MEFYDSFIMASQGHNDNELVYMDLLVWEFQ